MRPQPPPAPPSAAEPNHHPHHQPYLLDPKIWRAFAGTTVQIPAVNSRVYYFPQGHIDQASSPPEYSTPLLRSTPYVLCRIAAVQFLGDPLTDEVFAKLLLHPLHPSVRHLPPPPAGGNSGEVENNDDVVLVAKVLTPSDANNGGGFSVPRNCAESIFPLLNFQADPPVQNISITDVHGVAWEFRHIYRGTPRRHLLTTGWSKFVNSKRLVAGDTVVFVKNSKGEMFVGIRRTVRFASLKNSGGGAAWCSTIGAARNMAEEGEEGKKKQEEKLTEVFSRNGKGKLSPEEVVEAAEAAVQGKPFEVVYYPSLGWSEFVVKAEIVEAAMTVPWSPGMRVKMAVETEDSARLNWYQGSVDSVSVPESGDWRGSAWRMLQVEWDEPNILPNTNWVSPWQVELVSATPILHTGYPLAKRFRAAQGSGALTGGDGDPFLPLTGFTNSTMGHFNQTLLSYSTFPAGMQGARHDLFSAYNFSNFSSDNSRLYMGNSSGNNTVPRSNTLSTELNIGSSQSDNLSPDSQGNSFGTEFVGTPNGNSMNHRSGSFQLFGATIQTTQPVESGLHGAGGMNNLLDDSLTCSELLDRIDGIDGQCQRASTVGACYL